MTEKGAAAARGFSFGRARRESAIQKTIIGMSRAIRGSVFSEQIADRPGLLQETDPRVKTVGLLGLLVVVSFLRNWYIILGLYGLTLALAAASRISLRFFIKRVWLFIPLFAGIIAIPSLFSIFRPGDPLWTIWDFGGEVTLGPWSLGAGLAVTHQGLKGAVVLILRVATSVSLAVLLALTTRWADLLKALRVFLVPRIFVLILSMTYRYIFLSWAWPLICSRRAPAAWWKLQPQGRPALHRFQHGHPFEQITRAQRGGLFRHDQPRI